MGVEARNVHDNLKAAKTKIAKREIVADGLEKKSTWLEALEKCQISLQSEELSPELRRQIKAFLSQSDDELKNEWEPDQIRDLIRRCINAGVHKALIGQMLA